MSRFDRIEQLEIAKIAKRAAPSSVPAHTHTASDISNATATGIALITAVNAAAARTAIQTPTIYSGTSAPSSGLGSDGDLYFKY
jgi:hypothetical protein